MSDVSPKWVGLARGFAEAVVVGAIGAAYVWLTGADLGEWNALVPAGVLALRTSEGWADARIDPTKKRGKLGRSLAGKG